MKFLWLAVIAVVAIPAQYHVSATGDSEGPNECESCRSNFMFLLFAQENALVIPNVADFSKVCWAFQRYKECVHRAGQNDPVIDALRYHFRGECSSDGLYKLKQLLPCALKAQASADYQKCVWGFRENRPGFSRACFKDDETICKLQTTSLWFLDCAAKRYVEFCGSSRAKALGDWVTSFYAAARALRYHLSDRHACDDTPTTASTTTQSPSPITTPTTSAPQQCESCRSTFLYIVFAQRYPLVIPNVREFSKVCWAFRRYRECVQQSGRSDPVIDKLKYHFRGECSSTGLSKLRALLPCAATAQQGSSYRRCVWNFHENAPDYSKPCFDDDDKTCKLQEVSSQFIDCAAGQYKARCGSHRAAALNDWVNSFRATVNALRYELRDKDSCSATTPMATTTTTTPRTTLTTTTPRTATTTTTPRTTTTTTTPRTTTTTTTPRTTTTTRTPRTTTTTTTPRTTTTTTTPRTTTTKTTPRTTTTTPRTTTTTTTPRTTTTTTTPRTTTTTTTPRTTTTTTTPKTTTAPKTTTTSPQTTTHKPKIPMGAKVVGYNANCAYGTPGQYCALEYAPKVFSKTCTHEEFGLSEDTGFSILVYVGYGKGIYVSCDIAKGNALYFNIPACQWAGEIVAYARSTCYQNGYAVDEEYTLRAVDPYQALECGGVYTLKTLVARQVSINYVPTCLFTEVSVNVEIGCASHGFPAFPFDENRQRVYDLFVKDCPAPKCLDLH